jgi:hypothetical protein
MGVDGHGYYPKYTVAHTDGSPLKGKEHFVLSLDMDKSARRVALCYAADSNNDRLYEDLLDLYRENGWDY